MKTIIIATDFTHAAEKAASYAIQLFGIEEYQYLLFHAYPLHLSTPEIGEGIIDLLREDAENKLKKEQDRLKELFSESLRIETEAHYGTIDQSLVDKTNRAKAAVLVMGARKRKGIVKLLTGSKQGYIIGRANCTVLIVPETIQSDFPKKIALASDYEPVKNKKTYQVLQDIMERNKKTELAIFHLLEKESGETTARKKEKERLKEYFEDASIQFSLLKNETVNQGIIHFIETYNIQMLVVLARKENWLQRLFNNSTADHLANEINIPLLALND